MKFYVPSPRYLAAMDAMEKSQKREKREKELNIFDTICPECGSRMRLRDGKYGEFLGCSNYPNCKYTQSL